MICSEVRGGPRAEGAIDHVAEDAATPPGHRRSAGGEQLFRGNNGKMLCQKKKEMFFCTVIPANALSDYLPCLFCSFLGEPLDKCGVWTLQELQPRLSRGTHTGPTVYKYSCRVWFRSDVKPLTTIDHTNDLLFSLEPYFHFLINSSTGNVEK